MKIKFDSNYEMTINGKSVNTPSQIAVINPANGEIVGHAPDCTPELLNEAVSAATHAFRHWCKVPFADRQILLGKIARAARCGEYPVKV